MCHQLNPGQTFRVVAVSDKEGTLEMVQEGTDIALFAWPGSTLRIESYGQLVDDLSIPVPALPAGMSTRDFIHFLFGGPGRSGSG